MASSSEKIKFEDQTDQDGNVTGKRLKIDTLFVTNQSNATKIVQLLANLEALSSGKEVPFPDIEDEEPNEKKPKLEDLGYGPGVPLPPDPRPNFGGSNSEADDLFWEVKLASARDIAGYTENKHLDKISEILNSSSELINIKATSFSVPIINEAVCSGSLTVTQKLLEYNPDLLMTNGFGETSLKRGISLIKQGKGNSYIPCCIEILKAHCKAGTIDTSVFSEPIQESENWNSYFC
jgi:hypothetical protein